MKRYLMEFMGTFFLTLAIALMGGNGLAIGAMLVALSYMGAYISGAHYNPAFTISAFFSRAIAYKVAVSYMIAQVLGALLALTALYAAFQVPYVHPMALEKLWVILGIEFLFTFVFVMVFLAFTRTSHLRTNPVYGLGIGFALLAISFYGGLYNPAVAVGSLILDTVVKKQMTPEISWHIIIRVLAPLTAAFVASYIHRFVNED